MNCFREEIILKGKENFSIKKSLCLCTWQQSARDKEMWGRKPWSTELAPSMSDVDLPTGYSGEAGNLFNNSKSKSVLGAADETSAPTMNDSTGSSSITVTTWKSGAGLQMQTSVALKEFLTTVKEIICALIYCLELKKCYASFLVILKQFCQLFQIQSFTQSIVCIKKNFCRF